MTEMAEGLPSASGEKHGCARAPCTRVQTQTYAPRQMPPMSTALPTSAFRGMAHTPPRACMLPRSPLTTTHPTLLSHLCGPGMDIPAQLCPHPPPPGSTSCCPALSNLGEKRKSPLARLGLSSLSQSWVQGGPFVPTTNNSTGLTTVRGEHSQGPKARRGRVGRTGEHGGDAGPASPQLPPPSKANK